jgi:hypothetical protein
MLLLIACHGAADTDAVESDTEELPACAPTDECTTTPSECVALADNRDASTFTLRMSSLDFEAPSAFATGVVAEMLHANVTANLADCRLDGLGTFNWLLTFGGPTLVTGGGYPVPDPRAGYTMVDTQVGPLRVAPALATSGLESDGRFASEPTDLILPTYLDAAGTELLLFPLQNVVLAGQLSADHSCVGTYQADALTPPDCRESPGVPAFLSGGTADGFIDLDEADKVMFGPMQQSLCVLLAGDVAAWGDGASPARCKRTEDGRVAFQGDWCAATNSAATADCANAVRLHARFSASAVLRNGP